MHSSGLQREIPSCNNCSFDESAVLKALAAEPHALIAPQFKSTAYSNLGVALLGRSLEKAASLYEPSGAKTLQTIPCIHRF